MAAQGRGARSAEPSVQTPDSSADEARRRVRELQQAADDARLAAGYAREVERYYNLQARANVATPSGQVNVAGSDPMAGPVVRNAPYSGDAVTTVTQTLGDGTRIEQTTTAKYYRDSAGRVRREQTIIGLDWLNPSREPQTVITIDPDPDDGLAYQLDPVARTARRVPRGAASSGVAWFSLSTARVAVPGGRGAPPQAQGDARPTEESLGTRQFEGVKATGRRTTTTIPTGQIGNDRPIVITDERWESPELRVLVYSRQSDPRTSVVEYRLTNISRSEPPPDLFVVPPDYTINEGGGQRTGGAGGRGAPTLVVPGARSGGRGN